MSASLDEVEVIERNRAFYTAFRRRDMATMETIWAQSAKVACIHPGWQAIRGRGEVLASLRAILSQDVVPRIRCEDVSVHLVGDAAFVICEEVLREGRLVATNIFTRENGDWRLLHHQAGPLAPHLEEDDAADDSDGADADDGLGDLDAPGLLAFSRGPLAMGWSSVVRDRAPEVSDLSDQADQAKHSESDDAEAAGETGADHADAAAALHDRAVHASDSAHDPDHDDAHEEDDEAMGPGPLFHSPDEPLSDPGIRSAPHGGAALGPDGDDDGDDDGDAEHRSRSHPGFETRPISEIAELGDRTHPARRPARRLIN
jgi:hypothetical protein